MKKVLFTATVDSHILQFHLPFLKLFKDKGYEVHVATNGNEEIPYCDVKHIISFERSPLKLNNLKAIKELKRIINDEKFDIIHTHTPMGSVVTRLAAKQARKKYHTRVIYTAHGLHFFKGAPIKNWLMFYPVEKYLSRYTDTLILINQEDYELCKRKFKKCKDIQYVPGVGIDEKKFDFKLTKKEQKELRESLGLKENDFVLIYPAELNWNKNQLMIINAIEELSKKYSDIKVLLPGVDSYNGYYHNLVKEKKLEDYIKFLGYRKDIPRLLKISDLAVATSHREGLPLNVMEAMYVGLPIIATDCRGQRDLVKDNINGYLVDIDDQKRFNSCIERIYLSKGKNNKFGEESKDIIRDYLLDKILDNIKKIYYNSNKKICYLRSTAIYNDSRATKEIDSYKNNNYDVLVIGWNRLKEKINLDPSTYLFFNKEAKYGAGIKNVLNIIKFNSWMYKILKKNLNEFDIIHACDFDTALVGYLISKKYNKRLIYDIYDYYVDCHNLYFLKSIIEKLDIKIINYADTVLLCTEQRKLQISKAKPKNVVIIHNSPFKLDNKKIERSNNDKISVGYFGILQDDRLLIEISKEIIKKNNITFHIGGFGKYEQYFSDLSKKYDNIKYYGKLKYADVLENEKKCDVLFATYNPKIKNHKYSAPNKVYEAMALNLPIIVCNNTGVDDIVKKEKIGLAINYDANEFIVAVEKIKNMTFMGNRELFETKYSWNVMENRIIDIISDLRGENHNEENTNS